LTGGDWDLDGDSWDGDGLAAGSGDGGGGNGDWWEGYMGNLGTTGKIVLDCLEFTVKGGNLGVDVLDELLGLEEVVLDVSG
jgi:hypothetical protein